MPKIVDHDQRRREIADVVLRLVATEGLSAATFRRVAAECGWSLGAVQHYFDSSRGLLEAGIGQIPTRREERVRAELTALGRAPTEREVLTASMLTGLPLDEERRIECLAEAAWGIRDGAGTASDSDAGLRALLGLYQSLLERAREGGRLAEGVDPELEAHVLWSLVAVQARRVTLGVGTPEQVVDLIDYHLDRVFRT